MTLAQGDHGHDREQVRRDVEDHRTDQERPGPAEAVRLAVVELGATALAGGMVGALEPGRPDELAAGMAGEEGLLGGLLATRHACLRLDPLPDLVRLERRLGPDHDQDQGDEGEEAEAELDAGELAELHPGDDQAQEVDLGHRPRMQLLDEPEDWGSHSGETARMGQAQNPDRTDELE